ncbi:MAG: hypothetical protein AAFR75_12975 [Pseudomonadota bacterium]
MAASLFIWLITIAISVGTVVVAAAARATEYHAYATGIVSLAIALIALFEHRQLRSQGASEHTVAASTARHMGFVWAWAALSLLVTYQPLFEILRWPEWGSFTLAAVALAALCLVFAGVLDREASSDPEDVTFLNLARYLSIGQMVGMVVAIVGLALDGKFPAPVKANMDWQDWAANNVFFFGAFALLIISANALLAQKRRRAEA